MALKTDYKDDILDSSVNVNRTFSIIDNTTGQIIYPNVSLEETTVFSQEGDNHSAQITNEQNTEINQLDASLTDVSSSLTEKLETHFYEPDITSGDKGVNIPEWIKANIPKTDLKKGFSFSVLPSQTPTFWSGIMYSDNYNTWWAFYMHRDTMKMYTYFNLNGTITVKEVNNMQPNFSTLLKNFVQGTTVTIDTDSFLVGTVGNYATVTINGHEIVRTRTESVSLELPVKANDKILVGNWAAQSSDIALHVFGVR